MAFTDTLNSKQILYLILSIIIRAHLCSSAVITDDIVITQTDVPIENETATLEWKREATAATVPINSTSVVEDKTETTGSSYSVTESPYVPKPTPACASSGTANASENLSGTITVSATKPEVCDSSDCIKVATLLKQTMNFDVDPCEDFYQFVCGNFPKIFPFTVEEKSRSWFERRQQEILEEINDFLQSNYTTIESKAVVKARKLYKTCIITGEVSLEEDTEDSSISVIQKVLDLIGLSYRPGSNSKSFKWISVAAKLKKILGRDVFFSVSVGRDPVNTKIRRITIGKPNTDPTDLLDSKRGKKFFRKRSNDYMIYDSSEHMKLSLEFGKTVMNRMLILNGTNSNDNVISNVLPYIVNKSMITWTFIRDSLKPTVMTINQFQEFTDKIAKNPDNSSVISWISYLKYIFEGIEGVDLTFRNGNEPLVIYDIDYIKVMIETIADFDANKLESILWFESIVTVSEFASEDLRKAKNELDAEVSGKKKEDRKLYCSRKVSDIMSLAISYYLTVEPRFNIIRDKVIEMINNVQFAFDKILQENNWMDGKTRELALKKERTMKAAYVAFPTWLKNATVLDEYYEWVKEEENFENVLLEYRKRTTERLLSNLVIRDDPRDEILMSPIDINACYDPDENSVTLPAGVLGFPFYRYGLEAMNYGGIGVVIGHEITHGFDNTGRTYDADGGRTDWWANETANEYTRRARCFIDSYGSYVFKQGNGTITVDGEYTLDENIADNGGFREALRAYRKFVRDNGPEPLFPGFENYTHEQLLTIAYANLQCENTDPDFLEIADVHSPGPARVWGVAVNSEEFSKIWNCKKCSRMNPDYKCRVW